MQTSWPLAARLQAALLASPLSHRELAQQAGVKYYAVRRMRLDGVKNRGRNAEALCKFFGISEQKAANVSARGLQQAVKQTWDGTQEQGRLILDLIQSVGLYQVRPRPQGRQESSDG